MNKISLLLDRKNIYFLLYKLLKNFTRPDEFLLEFVRQLDVFRYQCSSYVGKTSCLKGRLITFLGPNILKTVFGRGWVEIKTRVLNNLFNFRSQINGLYPFEILKVLWGIFIQDNKNNSAYFMHGCKFTIMCLLYILNMDHLIDVIGKSPVPSVPDCSHFCVVFSSPSRGACTWDRTAHHAHQVWGQGTR